MSGRSMDHKLSEDSRLLQIEEEMKKLEAQVVKTISDAQGKVKMLEGKIDKLQREVIAVRTLLQRHLKDGK